MCFCVYQDAGSAFQVIACVSPASRARPATVPSPRKHACQMTSRYVAVWESVCVAGVCVTTPSAPGHSVRSVTPATAPVCLTGNLSLLLKHAADVIDGFHHHVLTNIVTFVYLYKDIFIFYYFTKKKLCTRIVNYILFI